ncbi:FtsX-like permease family protein, partial [Myxococcota bacterium]|nr:FtsX-like permease family protein [Myxococcota bacterium]
WETSTPVSLILLVGVTLGFLAGVVISYQILYTEVLDHMAEFATLKAMGYGDRFIQLVVVVEALFLSVVGFLPAIVAGSGLVILLGAISGLPAALSWADALNILALSISMCSLASFLALRRVRVLAPAELF